MNLVTFFPLALAGLIAPLRTWKRLFCGGLAIVLLGAIVATQSRAGFLGLVAVLVLAGIWLGRRRPGMIGAGLVAANARGTVRALSVGADGQHREQRAGPDRFVGARRRVMGEAFQAFLDRPLTGVGVGQFQNYAPEGRAESPGTRATTSCCS